MAKRAVLVLLAASCVGASQADDRLQSRYGLLTAQAAAGSNSYRIDLDGRHLADVDAEDIRLYRITPHGTAEHVIVEAWSPGLHCSSRYFILTIEKSGGVRQSPPFGECQRLQSATYLRNGARVVLASTTPTLKTESFVWQDTTLTRRPADGGGPGRSR